MKYIRFFKIVILFFLYVLSFSLNAQNTEQVPGIIIDYISPKTGKYIGSPSICILPNGDYIASHDEFGPKSTEYQSAKTAVFLSTDKGLTWIKRAEIDGQFWSTLFVMDQSLYIIGTNKAHGNIIIRKSTDSGLTWTIPYDSKHGLLFEGEYHTAPVPVIIHNGRIWRAVEYATNKQNKWPARYSAVMLSASVKSDLLNSSSWTRSNNVFSDSSYLDNKFKGWLEGNAVVDKSGNIVDILRVHSPEIDDEYAAVVNVSKNGKKAKFEKEKFVMIPGSSKKFTIRYDVKSKKYWSIVNIIQDLNTGIQPDRIRNNLGLISSTDLKTWDVKKVLLTNPDYIKHGFQYVDWVVDGNDIIYVSRTAFGDANNYHNTNYVTFHRITDFRSINN